MTEPGKLAPAPYKFCDAHFAMNCEICKNSPPPIAGDALPVLERPATPVDDVEEAVQPRKDPPPPPKPEFTDPQAVAVASASQRFSDAREALAMIEGQMNHALRTIETLRAKHTQAIQEQQDAKDALLQAVTGRKDA